MSEPRRLVDEEGSAAGELLRRVQPPVPAPGAAARNWRALEARRAAVGRTGRWGWFAAGGLVAAACAVLVVSLSSPTVESFVVTPHGGARVHETVAALKVVEALEFGRIDVDANRAPVEVQTPVDVVVVHHASASIEVFDDGVVVVHVTRGEVYLRSRERWLGEGVREELRGVVTTSARDAQEIAGGREPLGARATTDSARDGQQMTGVRDASAARATTDSARDAQQMTGVREVPGARPATDSAARDVAGTRDAPGSMALGAQQVTPSTTDSAARDSQQLRTPEIPGTPDSTTRDAQRTTKATDQDQLRLALSLRRTDPRRSAQLLRELAASPSHGEVALYELGRLQSSSLGDPSSAVATFREARARFPAGALRVEVSVSLIEALLAAKSPAAALTELDALAALPVARERPEELAVLRGDILRNLGRPADALRVLEPLAKGTSAWSARALFLLSDCQSRLGRSDEARVTLREYLRRFPTGAQASDVKRALGE